MSPYIIIYVTINSRIVSTAANHIRVEMRAARSIELLCTTCLIDAVCLMRTWNLKNSPRGQGIEKITTVFSNLYKTLMDASVHKIHISWKRTVCSF